MGRRVVSALLVLLSACARRPPQDDARAAPSAAPAAKAGPSDIPAWLPPPGSAAPSALAALPSSVPPPPAGTPPAVVVDELVALRAFLSADGLRLEDVVRRIGPVVAEHGPQSNVELRPRAPWMGKASTSRYPDGTIYLVEVAITGALSPDVGAAGQDREATGRPADSQASRPRMADLAARFGEGKRLFALHGEQSFIFYPPPAGPKWHVVVIADAARCRDLHAPDDDRGPCVPVSATSLVLSVTFRRDAR